MTRLDGRRLSLQVTAADCVARVLVGAIDLCADAGRPLSALQRVELIKAALLELDGLDGGSTADLEVERVLARNGF